MLNKTDTEILSDLANTIDQANQEVTNLRSKYEEKFDNLSENAQQNEKGQELQSMLNDMETAIDNIQQGIDTLGAYF